MGDALPEACSHFNYSLSPLQQHIMFTSYESAVPESLWQVERCIKLANVRHDACLHPSLGIRLNAGKTIGILNLCYQMAMQTDARQRCICQRAASQAMQALHTCPCMLVEKTSGMSLSPEEPCPAQWATFVEHGASSVQVEKVLQPALGGLHIRGRAAVARRQIRRARLWELNQLQAKPSRHLPHRIRLVRRRQRRHSACVHPDFLGFQGLGYQALKTLEIPHPPGPAPPASSQCLRRAIRALVIATSCKHTHGTVGERTGFMQVRKLQTLEHAANRVPSGQLVPGIAPYTCRCMH